jgi:signal transduction histidine kinase
MKLVIQLISIMMIAVILAIVIVGFVSFNFTKNSLEESIGNNQQELAKETMNKIDRILYQKYQEIQVIADANPVEDSVSNTKDYSLVRERLDELLLQTGPWDLISLVDKEGEVIVSTSRLAIELNKQQQIAFSNSMSGSVYYSDLLRSQVTGKPTIIFSAPIRNGREPSRPIIGVVMAEFSWPVILEVFDELETGPEKHIHLFNDDGVTIGVPTFHNKEILQKDLTNINIVREALDGKCSSSFLLEEEGHFEGDGHQDNVHIPALSSCALQTGYLGFKSQGWGLIIETSQDIVLAPVRQLVKKFLLVSLIIILLLFPVIFLISRTISKPLSDLSKSNRLISEGKFKEAQQQQQQQQQQQRNLPTEIKELMETRQIALKGLVVKSELEKANIELKKLDKLKSVFLSMTSHELKTPITPIRLEAELLMDGSLGKLNQKQQESTKIILRNINHLNDLLSDVLDSAKIEAHKLKTYFEYADVANLMKKTVEDFTLIAKKKNITLTTNIQQLPKTNLDPKRITQVLTNLIGNGIKFTPAKGRITVSAKKEGNNIHVRVKDTGVGIPQNMVKKIFDKFSQVNPSYLLKEKGTGLGLSISKGIIEQHNGKIWAESSGKGKGSMFHFTIPITKTLINKRK